MMIHDNASNTRSLVESYSMPKLKPQKVKHKNDNALSKLIRNRNYLLSLKESIQLPLYQASNKMNMHLIQHSIDMDLSDTPKNMVDRLNLIKNA